MALDRSTVISNAREMSAGLCVGTTGSIYGCFFLGVSMFSGKYEATSSAELKDERGDTAISR